MDFQFGSIDVGAGDSTGSLFWYVISAIGMWPMLTKAGFPGWGGFIPIWNIYLQIKLAGRSGVLIFLYLVPLVNIIVALTVAVGISRAFGRGAVYGVVMLCLLQPIGFLITGFGSARYLPVHRGGERLARVAGA